MAWVGWGASPEEMRHEPAQVSCDSARVLANAQAGRLVVTHPDAKDGSLSIELGHRRLRLIDVPLVAVIAAGFLDHHAVFDPGHVAALAAEFGFADVDRKRVV